ncbi:MAG TPA: alternative cytochrome c oxidase polypeptide CoxN, partial [Pelagibacteraceae bacterium]|nr:alternative cytochrome c oxidase polypeptide CoxN [Pelagibacteraceae bacterium]
MNKFFETLAEKPWEERQAKIDNKHQGKTLSLSKYKLGLRTIMVVSTIIFSFFIIAYADRMLIHDWRS